jgi:hypothetical protein
MLRDDCSLKDLAHEWPRVGRIAESERCDHNELLDGGNSLPSLHLSNDFDTKR